MGHAFYHICIFENNIHCITIDIIVIQLTIDCITVNVIAMQYAINLKKKASMISVLFRMFAFCILNFIFVSCRFRTGPYNGFSYQSLYPILKATNGTPIDVVILAGQSNMSGVGFNFEASTYLSDDEYQKVSNGIEGVYIYACNDLANANLGCAYLPYSKVKFGYGGYEILFGPEVGFALECQKAKKNIVIIKYTAAGMPMNHFLEDGDIANNMKFFLISCLHDLISKGYIPTIRAVCWMQGEGDCDYGNASTYYEKEKRLIKYLRDDFNSNLIFIDARVTDWQLINPNCFQDLVNDAKEKIIQEEDLCFLIDSTGLQKGLDGAHYNTKSTIELGRRFGRSFISSSNKSEQ